MNKEDQVNKDNSVCEANVTDTKLWSAVTGHDNKQTAVTQHAASLLLFSQLFLSERKVAYDDQVPGDDIV